MKIDKRYAVLTLSIICTVTAAFIAPASATGRRCYYKGRWYSPSSTFKTSCNTCWCFRGDEGFYNIAHMVNTEASADWAIAQGANGVEIDLAFHNSNGGLLQFRHSASGEPCDCSCLCPAPVWRLCSIFQPNSVCAKLLDDVSSRSPCRAKSSVKSLLNHLAKKTTLALIIIDSKIDAEKMNPNNMQRAGAAVVDALEAYLFRSNYLGKVIIGSPKINTFPYIQAAVDKAKTSAFKSRIYFTFDLEKNNIIATLQKLLTLPTKNIVYGTGISACVPKFVIKEKTLQLALLNKLKGVVGLSYVWTLDKESSMKSDLRYVQGILTNYPGKLYDVLMKAGIKLATPTSTIPISTNSLVTTSTSQLKCDCDHHKGGCSISRAAPARLACECKYKGFWTCGGSVVQCRDNGNSFCKTPDKSVYACLQGGGDCEGYKTATCDCNYHPGGCSISKAPPAYTACKCKYKGFRTCSGDVTRCKDENSPYCKKPDTSIHTCVLGGGDCEGYKGAKCDCDHHHGGCTISAIPPPNTACKCKYKGFWTCRGDVVKCLDFNSRYCKHPDKSVHSCFQGDGDCEGYKRASCDCDYHRGGCTISTVPPRNTACKCKYKGFWSCGGDITRCRNFDNHYCKNPDSSRNTCIVGGGDCGGY